MNKNLHKAKEAKNDEFYTQLADIANELRHYKEQFKGKVVFCNCDDPDESEFFKYFALNFNYLELKKLITTHYAGTEKPAYKIELTEVTDVNGDGAIDLADVEYILKHSDAKTLLEGDGDFRSPECIELLKEADIVVTNPPFSLFREYVDQLIRWKKSFLIIGNDNAITYKDVFKHIKDNKIWLGYGKVKEFRTPDGSIRKFGNIGWFTNLFVSYRHKSLPLWARYSPEEYPHYDNYDAINVNKVVDIPKDWDGAIGVPITFLGQYNPKQFEITSCNDIRLNGITPFKGHGLIKDKDSSINGKPTYVRIVIKRIGETQ